MIATVLTALTASALAACFAPPQPVRIDGWSGDAMEPFVSRDGRFLFFNSSNAPGAATDIYWARRAADDRFVLEGPLPGANSPALDGVPSLARDGTFALISPRAYARLHATVWIGRWTEMGVQGLEAQPALAPPGPGGFNMDAEVSADGRRLYVTDNQWRPVDPPARSRLRLAVRTDAGWRIDPAADRWFAAVNGGGLVYAPALSGDERELFVTRLVPGASEPRILVSTRADRAQPFSAPAPIPAIEGFVEGPTVAPDGALYFHKRLGARFALMRSARTCPLEDARAGSARGPQSPGKPENGATSQPPPPMASKSPSER